MSKELTRLEVLYESLSDNVNKILEVILAQQKQVSRIPKIETDLKEVKDDIKIIKKAVSHTNLEVKLLDRRVTKLESV
jgi:polyhydroxyalkanoate synthesis regulator phasin